MTDHDTVEEFKYAEMQHVWDSTERVCKLLDCTINMASVHERFGGYMRLHDKLMALRLRLHGKLMALRLSLHDKLSRQ